MHKWEIKPSLHKTLKRLCKKDPIAYEAVLKKIEEIITCEDVEHYKNLRHNLKDRKRVHVMRSFILVFNYDKKIDFISFLDYDHHDNIYK